jgi:hypothetical protein
MIFKLISISKGWEVGKIDASLLDPNLSLKDLCRHTLALGLRVEFCSLHSQSKDLPALLQPQAGIGPNGGGGAV